MVTPVKYKGFKVLLGDESNPTFGIIVDDASKQLHICEPGDANTDWAQSAASHPTIFLHSATTPETYYMQSYVDTTHGYINGAGVTDLTFQIDGTGEFAMNATELEVASGNYIQFLGNNGILDSGGNEVVMFEAVGTAVNYLNIKNAVTGNNIQLECQGTADKGFTFTNDQDEEILILSATATAISEVTITNAAGTASPSVASSGSATSIGLALTTKGTANSIDLQSGGTTVVGVNASELEIASGADIQFLGDDGILDSNGNELVLFTATGTAVNEITITNAATTDPPSIASTGSGSNIDLKLGGKGTGILQLDGTTSWTANGTSAVTLGTLGPTAAGTDVTEWLTVKNEDGSTRYIAAWG